MMNDATYDHDRTVTAFFDTRAAADKARADVIAAGVPSSMVSIVEGHGATTTGATTTGTTTTGATANQEGFWGSVKNLFAPEEDKHAYAEGLSRGGYLLSVHTSEAHYDRVLDILDHEGAVDMNERETQWRSEGWSGTHASAPMLGTSTAAGYGAAEATTGMRSTGMESGMTSTGLTSTAAAAPVATGTARAGLGAGLGTEEGTIQLAEETLRVGKRDVNHGRVRLRSYVMEKPVNESISLHSERVDVARRPVDRPLAAGENLFAERTLSAEEHDEEAVVSKDARVYEEVSLGKVARDRTQEIHDTVRRTEVEVDDGRTGGTARTGLAGGTTSIDDEVVVKK